MFRLGLHFAHQFFGGPFLDGVLDTICQILRRQMLPVRIDRLGAAPNRVAHAALLINEGRLRRARIGGGELTKQLRALRGALSPREEHDPRQAESVRVVRQEKMSGEVRAVRQVDQGNEPQAPLSRVQIQRGHDVLDESIGQRLHTGSHYDEQHDGRPRH